MALGWGLGVTALCASCVAHAPRRAAADDTLRPQLSDPQAAQHSRQAVLAAAGAIAAPQRDDWDPLADPVITGEAPPPAWHYEVDPARADGRRRFATVQAALRQAHVDVLAGRHAGVPRLYIGIAPGTYPELVVVPPTPIPLTLWGRGATPADVRIEAGLHARMPGSRLAELLAPVFGAADQHPDIAAPWQACRQRETIGTDCSATLRVRNHGFQLRGVTVANRFQIDQPGASAQAVALVSDGADRVHLEQVQLLAWQDTLYLRSAPDTLVRVAVHRSRVAGDVDFIFGNAIAWFGRSEIRFLGARPGRAPDAAAGVAQGWVAAPSTSWRAPYGFVFEDCDFSSDDQGIAAPGTPGRVHLARQWFIGARCSPFGQATAGQPNGARCVPEPALAAGASLPADGRLLAATSLAAVGKMVVLRSRLGPHLHPRQPWADWASPPEHPAHRPVLPDSDRWWQLLQAAGHEPARWGWARPAPAQPWLAEYRNILSDSRAGTARQ